MFYPEKVRKPKAMKKKTKKVKAAVPETASESEDGENTPHEDHPFEAAASLDDIDVGLAAHTELPMELDGEPLTAAELVIVNLAVNEFAEKVRTLAAEANAIFADEFGIQCTDAERKSASRIMDVVSSSFIYLLTPYSPTAALQARFKSESFSSAT